MRVLVNAAGDAAFAGAFAEHSREQREAIQEAMGIVATVANNVLTQEAARAEQARLKAVKPAETPAPVTEAKQA